MIDSEAAVCNLALVHAQVRKRIADLDTDSSTEGSTCRDFFDHCRDKLFEDYRWPFAEAMAFPAALGGTNWSAAGNFAKKATVNYSGEVYVSLQDANLNKQPDTNATWWRKITRDGWDFAFARPADMVALRQVFPGVRAPTDSEETPRALGHDEDLGVLILCDEEEPDLRFTRRVEAPVLWPSGFTEAMALRLGSKLAIALSGNAQLAAFLDKSSDEKAAAAMASQQAQMHEMPRGSRFIEARGSGQDVWMPPPRVL